MTAFAIARVILIEFDIADHIEVGVDCLDKFANFSRDDLRRLSLTSHFAISLFRSGRRQKTHMVLAQMT